MRNLAEDHPMFDVDVAVAVDPVAIVAPAE